MLKPMSLTDRFYAKEELTVRERKAITAGPIRINAAKCKKCDEVIMSNNRHDYKTCKCGNLSVDGGSWYAKRSFKEPDSYEEMLESYKEQEDLYFDERDIG
jgi:hypothetical protein